MPYLRQLYEDEHHFVCDRVVEFKKRLASRPSEPAEAICAMVSDPIEKYRPEILASKRTAHGEDQTQRFENGGEHEHSR